LKVLGQPLSVREKKGNEKERQKEKERRNEGEKER